MDYLLSFENVGPFQISSPESCAFGAIMSNYCD